MAASSAVKPGINAAVYRNSGSYASPTWTEVTLIRDVTINGPWNLADASIRATKAVLQAKTQIALTGQIVIRADDADAGYQALWDASCLSTSSGLLDLLILDGDIATEGAMGFRAHWNINFSSQDQGAGNVVYTTFDIAPGWSSDGYPSKCEMGAASSPTFTAF